MFIIFRTKDDQVIETANAFELVEDIPNETYKLIIHKVQLSDEGYYKVTAKNKLGEDYKEARLKTISELFFKIFLQLKPKQNIPTYTTQ